MQTYCLIEFWRCLVETHWNKEYEESQFEPPYRGYQHPDQIDWARYGPDRPGKARGELFSVLFTLFTPEVGTGRFLPVKFWVGGSVYPSDRLLRSAVAGIVGHFVLPGSSPHSGHSLTLSPHSHLSRSIWRACLWSQCTSSPALQTSPPAGLSLVITRISTRRSS